MLMSNKSVVRSTILFLNVSWQRQQCDIISLLINTTQQKSNKRFPWTWRLCRKQIVCVCVYEKPWTKFCREFLQFCALLAVHYKWFMWGKLKISTNLLRFHILFSKSSWIIASYYCKGSSRFSQSIQISCGP